jgi:hypothetical protein
MIFVKRNSRNLKKKNVMLKLEKRPDYLIGVLKNSMLM